MKRIVIIFSVVFIFIASQMAFAAGKKMTLTGVVNSGTGSSSIIVGDKEYTFGTDSPVANKIFKACQTDDKCTVVVVVDKDGGIEKVISAKKVK